MVEGRTVSHLLCKLMASGVAGGAANLRPLILEQGVGGPMTFYFVRANNVRDVLGQVETPFTDVREVTAQIVDANQRWGWPSAEMLQEVFPNGRLIPERVEQPEHV